VNKLSKICRGLGLLAVDKMIAEEDKNNLSNQFSESTMRKLISDLKKMQDLMENKKQCGNDTNYKKIIKMQINLHAEYLLKSYPFIQKLIEEAKKEEVQKLNQ
jgi:hypothetical protein